MGWLALATLLLAVCVCALTAPGEYHKKSSGGSSKETGRYHKSSGGSKETGRYHKSSGGSNKETGRYHKSSGGRYNSRSSHSSPKSSHGYHRKKGSDWASHGRHYTGGGRRHHSEGGKRHYSEGWRGHHSEGRRGHYAEDRKAHYTEGRKPNSGHEQDGPGKFGTDSFNGKKVGQNAGAVVSGFIKEVAPSVMNTVFDTGKNMLLKKLPFIGK